jgi:hypothetical protein
MRRSSNTASHHQVGLAQGAPVGGAVHDAPLDGLGLGGLEDPALDPLGQRLADGGHSAADLEVVEVEQEDGEPFARHLLRDPAAHVAGAHDRKHASAHEKTSGDRPV